MKKPIGVAMLVAGLLMAGSARVQAAAVSPDESLRVTPPIQLAQMNSPGDGLTPGSARSGNGRPRMYGHDGRRRHWHGHHRHWHRHWHHRRRWR